MKCSYHNKIKINISTIWSLKSKFYLDSISFFPLIPSLFPWTQSRYHIVLSSCLPNVWSVTNFDSFLFFFFFPLASIILRSMDEVSCRMLADMGLLNKFLIVRWDNRFCGKNVTEVKFLITSFQGINYAHTAPLEMLTFIFYFR